MCREWIKAYCVCTRQVPHSLRFLISCTNFFNTYQQWNKNILGIGNNLKKLNHSQYCLPRFQFVFAARKEFREEFNQCIRKAYVNSSNSRIKLLDWISCLDDISSLTSLVTFHPTLLLTTIFEGGRAHIYFVFYFFYYSVFAN